VGVLLDFSLWIISMGCCVGLEDLIRQFYVLLLKF